MSTLDTTRLSNFVRSLPEALDDGLFLENLPIGVYACDAHGLILRYNRAAVALWGREPRLGEPAERFCGSYRLLDLGGTHISSAECPMAIALATGRSCQDERIQIERPDGSRIVALVNIEVLKNARGQVTGAVNVFRDSGSSGWGHGHATDQSKRLEGILHSLPAAVYTTDLNGRITFYNEAAAELWGVRPEIHRSEFCGSWKLYWPDGTSLPHDQCPMAMALKEGRAIKGKEAVAERPDGTRVPFLAYPTPLFDEAGSLTGAINMLVDISGRKKVEIAAQKFAALVESSDDAIISKDLDGIITSWNRGAQRLFGYAGDEVVGKPVTILFPEDRQDEEPEILARIRRGERIEHYETIRRRKDGSLIDISLSVSPIVDSAGGIVGASKIARNITDKRRAEEQKDLLLREMDHRIKNLFALANGVVSLSGRNATSVAALVSDLQGRFCALSRAHSLTMPKARGGGTEQVATLHALIYKVTEPYLSDQAQSRVVITGPDLSIGPGMLTNFALVLHEFATNALKYGALAVPHGKVRIKCFEEGENFSITWEEHDRLEENVEAPGEGFGSCLARATIESLGGNFCREFKSDGVEILLTLPRRRMSE
ncbi:PAS domain S-box protein [Bradyrhizobium sp. SSUT112]|uniref:PAS domain S-box protein n=1 Tax=Bradyrhizobium sp. SSUT112 TaxID=3040604 RepID=UPI0024498F3D|nr:PAS domain S-box protein [Bradyrhizobium sp. SSUT112]MDH2357041.1 PAS domain S-box protein [Bradyrhizobium sp. SSUT112]